MENSLSVFYSHCVSGFLARFAVTSGYYPKLSNIGGYLSVGTIIIGGFLPGDFFVRHPLSSYFLKHFIYFKRLFITTKVQFHALSIVVAVETQGQLNKHVTSYRLAYSSDCVTFNDLVDVSGTNVVVWSLWQMQSQTFLFLK